MRRSLASLLLFVVSVTPACAEPVRLAGQGLSLDGADAECGLSMLQHSHGRGPAAASREPASALTYFITTDWKDTCGPNYDTEIWIEYFSFVQLAIESAAESLRAEGIVLTPTTSKAEADILFCHPMAAMEGNFSNMTTEAKDPKDPAAWEYLRGGTRKSTRRQALVFVEDEDAASVYTPPSWAELPEVLRILKPSRWHVEELRFTCEDPTGFRPLERHMALLKILAKEPTEAPLTDETLLRMFKETDAVDCPDDLPAETNRKVVIGFPLKGSIDPSAWPPRSEWKPLKDRSLDVVFASGFEIVPNALEFGKFRVESFERMKSLRDKHPEWRMYLSEDTFWETSNVHSNFDEYRDRLCDAKVLVSNLAYGEWSSKDIEAALCGTVVVKTGCSLIDALPDIYRPSATCLDVHPDLHNLESVLAHALDEASLPQLEALQEEAWKAASPMHDGGQLGFLKLPQVRDVYEAIVREVASRSS